MPVPALTDLQRLVGPAAANASAPARGGMSAEGWLMLIGITLGGLLALVAGGLMAKKVRRAERGDQRVLLVFGALILGGVGLAALFVAFVLGSCAFGGGMYH
ncbi:MAG: hypothetical protein AB7O97_15195 [Planctomycetota bacterium]